MADENDFIVDVTSKNSTFNHGPQLELRAMVDGGVLPKFVGEGTTAVRTNSSFISKCSVEEFENPVEILEGSTGFSFTPNVCGLSRFSFTTADGRLFSIAIHVASSKAKDKKSIVTHEPQKGVLEIHPNGSFTYSPGDGTNGADSARYQLIRGDQVITVEFIIQVIDYEISIQIDRVARSPSDPTSIYSYSTENKGYETSHCIWTPQTALTYS